MRRIRFYVLVAILGGCASRPLDDLPYVAANYKEYLRHEFQTNTPVMTQFPGLLDCKVAAATERYTPAELEALDQMVQQLRHVNTPAGNKALNDERSRVTLNDDDYGWQKCGHILAAPGSFSSAQDMMIKNFSSRYQTDEDALSVSPKIRAGISECAWTVLQHRLSAQEMQELDDYATGKAGITYMLVDQLGVDFRDINTYCPSVTTELLREIRWYQGY